MPHIDLHTSYHIHLPPHKPHTSFTIATEVCIPHRELLMYRQGTLQGRVSLILCSAIVVAQTESVCIPQS